MNYLKEDLEGLYFYSERFKEVLNRNRSLNILTIKDCLVYYVDTSMANVNFRKLIESTSIKSFELPFSQELNSRFLNDGFIRTTSLTDYSNGYFITIKGLSFLMYNESFNVDGLFNILSKVDYYKIPDQDFRLKKEEVLLVVLFLACNATNREYALKEYTKLHSIKLYERLVSIENELNVTVPNLLKNRIDFKKGKKVSWTRYLGEIKDLSKTGIYIKEEDKSRNRIVYYLNLKNAVNYSILFKLCFSHLDIHERIALKNYISKANIQIKIGMSEQVSCDLISPVSLDKLLY
jgi:hypothetical protein